MFRYLLLMFAFVSDVAWSREAMDHPNVVLIYLDDSGYGDYSYNGNPVIETPHLEQLAAGGANFTQFHVTSPACSASRYSLLTGKYPGRSGFPGWVIGPETKAHLKTTDTTIAQALKARGYATAMVGKWHLGTPNDLNRMSVEALPLAHGFDSWTGTNVSHDYDNAMLIQSDPSGNDPVPGYKVIARNLASQLPVCDSLTSRYTKHAVDFIQSHKDEPFFLYVAHNLPHLALHASEKFRGKSRRGLLGDVMAEVDDSAGQIVSAIQAAGVGANTLVIFSSDNGPWIRYQDVASDPKYGEARLNIGYALPFRDGKGSNWEGGHRVPGVFYWPGVIPANRQLEPASTLDVLPTVLALCEADIPKSLDGRDIRNLLAPERFPSQSRPFEFAYSDAANKPAAFREGPWKLHIRLTSQLGTTWGFAASREKPLLFNVEQDLGERIDRAAEHPEIVVRLLEKLGNVEKSLTREPH